MGKHILQIPCQDGSVYAYDADEKTLKKICDISILEAPQDVQDTLLAAGLMVLGKKGKTE